MLNKTEQMKLIRDEVVNLTESPLYEFRVQNSNLPVFGEGSHEAKIMFVGEAPGRNEAKTGRPFCGAAGKLLDELLASVDIKREEVYVTNIVKDRPPKNRDPLPEEIRIYGPFLDRQIEIIQPRVIATLGRFSTRYILEKFGCSESTETIGKLHGRCISAKTNYGTVFILPLYHPAATIYNRQLKEVLARDFEQLRNVA